MTSKSSSNVSYRSGFSLLENPLADRPLVLSLADEKVKDAWGLFIGKTTATRAVTMKAVAGGQSTDILWVDLLAFVVSGRVVSLLNSHDISGWLTYPVVVRDRRNRELPNYQGFVIRGHEVDFDLHRSEIHTRRAVPEGKPFQVYRGLFVKEEQWDGSDFFRHRGFILVTKKVRDLFVKENIRNVRFTPLPELELDAALFRPR